MSIPGKSDSASYSRFAFILITIGILIALESFFKLGIVFKLWPVLTLILGGGLIGIYKQRKTTGLLFLGSGEYLILFSILALYCNFTSWSRMSFLWPLFIIFMGVVFFTLYGADRKKRSFLFLGLVLISLSIFFYLMFKVDLQYWWSIFILVGISILISEKTK